MKSMGIVRKMDPMGRIVLPMELRRKMGINVKDDLEIFIDGNMIILQKDAPNCVFCESSDNLISFQGKYICHHCLDKIISTRR